MHADDVIIQGSLCVGSDCVNGESFGFDTLRLKENNLRIKAQDTSSSASFPTNDWQITFNDSTNGGQNKFSIDDIDNGRTPFTIEAGAPSNSLYVDDGGRVGFGTSTPVVPLHVKDGNTPTLRLEQDGSSGFASYTWDVASNETNFFIRDATGGSTLPFRIRPGAPSNAIDISADGDVFIGLASNGNDQGDLVVGGSGLKTVEVVSTNGGGVQYRLVSDSPNRRFVAFDTARNVKSQIVFGDDDMRISGPTTAGGDLWAIIGPDGITTQGPDCDTPCDGVFDPAVYQVESIEENAAFMWDNKHLRAVGPTGPGLPFNMTEKMAGMLHELEKAHIYIDQLNAEQKNALIHIDQLNAELQQQRREIDALMDRLEK